MDSNYEKWLVKRKEDAYGAICEITELYEDYHYQDYIVYAALGEILKKYGFID